MLRIKFFASIRERLDVSLLEFEYAGEKTVQALLNSLVHKDNKFEVLNEQEVLVAVNQTICAKSHGLNDGDEIAFFPPVTGG